MDEKFLKSLESIEEKCSILEKELSFSRKREGALASRLNWMTSVLEVEGLIVFILDKDGLIREWGAGAESLYGFSYQDASGRHYLEVLFGTDGGDKENIRNAFGLIYSGQSFTEFKSEVISESGEKRMIEWRLSSIYTADEEWTGVLAVGRDITDYEICKKNMKKKEILLSRIQRSIHMGYWEWDIVNDELFWSRETYAVYGMEEDQSNITYEVFLSMVCPEDRLFVSKAIEGALSNQNGYDLDYRLFLKDGSLKWVHEEGIVEFDEEHSPVRMSGIIKDITDRKALENRLSNAEDKYKVFIDNIPHKIFYKDKDFQYVACNHKYAMDFNSKEEDLKGKSDFDLQTEPVAEKHRSDDQMVIEGGQTVSYEDAYVMDGHNIFERVTKFPYRNIDGKIIGLIGIVDDVTKMREIERRSKEHEDHLYNIIQTISDVVIIADNEMICLLWSPSAERMFGYNKEELIEQPLPFVFAEEIRKARLKLPDRDSVKGSPWRNCKSYETIMSDKNGINLTVEFSLTEWMKEEKIIFTCLIRDISERKRVQDELRRYAKIHSELLQEINHRVKNNLMAAISLLHRNKKQAFDKGLLECGAVLDNVGGRIESLLIPHAMLSASGFRPIPAMELFRKISEKVMNNAPDGTRISYHIAPSSLLVKSNEAHQLALVFNEIASNTLRHAIGSHRMVTISIDVEENPPLVSIIYKDDGPGFSLDIVSGAYSGLGIGFELIHGIIKKKLNGEVQFLNEGGAVVMITLQKDIFTEKNGY